MPVADSQDSQAQLPIVILIAAGCSRRLSHLTQEIPKSFLDVGGKRILERNFEALEAAGLHELIVVVGYRREVFFREIGETWGKLRLRYVSAPDYASTGHGWSLYRARPLWQRQKRPVVLVHADVVYDPKILRRVLADPRPDVIAVDDRFESHTGDEVLVCGAEHHISAIRKISESPDSVLGEVVGINRWSPELMRDLFGFMERFFIRFGPDFNWEPVVDAFLRESSRPLAPVLTSGLRWINVNYEDDLRTAEELCKLFEHTSHEPI